MGSARIIQTYRREQTALLLLLLLPHSFFTRTGKFRQLMMHSIPYVAVGTYQHILNTNSTSTRCWSLLHALEALSLDTARKLT